MENKLLGQYGEDLAANLLVRKGYRLLERNFKNKIGEIDLIMKDGKIIVFVEVKTRASLACGLPQESVHFYKQKKMVQVALSYLKFRFGTCDILSRFDVVSIVKDLEGKDKIEHIVEAFWT